MRRYELVEDGQTYFWEVALGPQHFDVREGVGEELTRERQWDFWTVEGMRAEYRKQIDWRERMHFVLVRTDPEDDEVVRSWLSENATELNPEIESQIAESPDDPDAWVVYGDWLETRGSARGELVQIQAALAKDPDNVRLKDREGTLLTEYERSWLGDMADIAGTHFTWRYGFLSEVELRGTIADVESECAMLASLAAARLLSRLKLEFWAVRHPLDSFLDRFLRAFPPSVLFERLEIASPFVDLTVQDLPSWATARLRELRLEVDELEILPLVLPRLQRLDLSYAAAPLEPGTIVAPALEALSLTLTESGGNRFHRSRDYGRVIGRRIPHFIPALIDQAPALTKLGVRIPAYGDGIVRMLLAQKGRRMRRLTELDLSHSGLTDAGVQLLLDDIQADGPTAKLRRVDLQYNRYGQASCSRLWHVYGNREGFEYGESEMRPPWLYDGMYEDLDEEPTDEQIWELEHEDRPLRGRAY